MPIRFSLPTPRELWTRLAAKPSAQELRVVVGSPSEQGALRSLSDGLEYSPDLKGTAGIDQLDHMSQSDPTIGAILSAYNSPILNADWEVEVGDDMDSRAADARDLVEEQLFNMEDQPWFEWIEEALEFLTFGFYSFEKVWEVSQGQFRLKRLSPRPPTEIEDVVSDQAGLFAGIEQNLAETALADLPPEISGDPRQGRVFIPAWKLCHLVRRRRGADFTGQSLLRHVYKPWWIKKELEMIAGIVIERHATGIPTLRETGDKTSASKGEAQTALMGLHAREAQHLVVPKGWEFAVEGLRGGTISPEKFLEYCDVAIARGAGAEFIMMGSGNTGSFAQHADKTSLFMMGLNRTTRVLRECIERQVIRDIVRYNMGGDFPLELMPILTHTRLDSRNVTELANAAVTLANSKLLGEITNEDRNALRKLLEFSKLDEDEDAEDEPEAPEPPIVVPDEPDEPEEGEQPEGAEDDGDETMASAKHVCAGRVPMENQLPKCDFPVTAYMDADGINASLDSTREAIMRSARTYQRKQVNAMVDFAREQWQAAGSRNRKIMRPPIPHMDEVADAFTDELAKLAQIGRQQVADEVAMQAVHHGKKLAVKPVNRKSERSIDSYLTARGSSMSDLLAKALNSAYQFSILPMVREGEFDALALDRAMNELALAELAKKARLAVSEALSLGRRAQQEELEADGDIDYYVYSTATESDTCPACAAMEGVRIEVGSPEFEQYYPPLRNGTLGPCEGADGCNCDIFAVYKPGAV